MKKGTYSKLVVSLIIILNILFTAAVLYIFLQTSSEPAALIAAWFAFTTGELSLTAFIKNQKIKKGGNDDV